jgi:drug/metabolite transporter (DMT)-like permease
MALGNAIAVAAALLAIAGVLIAIITSNQKNRQAKLEFLRNALERDAPLDPELIDKVLRPNKTRAGKPALPPGQGALVAGILVIAFGVGYAILAYFIAIVSPDALLPMFGIACMFGCIGIGLLIVSKVIRSERNATNRRE